MKQGTFKHTPEYKEFVSRVCELSECEEKYLDCKIHKQEFVRARYLIMAYRRKIEGLSLARSASVFKMDHASTINAIKVIKNDYHTSEPYRKMFAEIFEKYPILIK